MKKAVLFIIMIFHVTLAFSQSVNYKFEPKKSGGRLESIKISYDSISTIRLNSTETRKIIIRVVTTHTKTNSNKSMAIKDSIKYTFSSVKDHQVEYIYQTDGKIKKDSFPIPFSENGIVSKPDSGGKAIKWQGNSPHHWTISDLRHVYRKFKTPGRVYAELSATLGFADQYMITKAQDGYWDERTFRQQYEIATLGQNYNLRIGMNKKKRNSSAYFDVNWIKQGFTALKHTVDWSTGAPVNYPLATPKTFYKFEYAGFGLGYSYNSYEKKAYPVFDAGMYFNWLLAPKRLDFNKFTWGINVSPGLKFRLFSNTDFRIMPSLSVNLINLRRTDISTGLVNIGLRAAFRFYF